MLLVKNSNYNLDYLRTVQYSLYFESTLVRNFLKIVKFCFSILRTCNDPFLLLVWW